MYKENNVRWFRVVVFVLAAIGVSKAAGEPGEPLIDMEAPVAAVAGDLEFRECTVSAEGRDRKVQCAWYEVAENPAEEIGKTIKLFIVRLPAKRNVKDIDDPVLFVAGGPGQAASETFLFADHQWPSLAKKRDFYLIDQRGTGNSNLMNCNEVLGAEEFVEYEYKPEKMKRLTRECLAIMPGDVRYYTTDITVQDFEKVRAALGIKQWNLLGVSYGTRVATHYMRRYPESLRTVILDSVVPPQNVLGLEIAAKSQDVLGVLFKRCEETPGCAQRMPELQKNVNALFEQLEAAPVTTRVEKFRTAVIEDTVFTRDHLATLIRLYLYNPYTLALLPPMLHEAAVNQNFSPLARAANRTIRMLENSLAVGLHHSVMCTEEYPFYDQITQEQEQANRNSYMGMYLVNMMGDICSVWPRGEYIETMKTPLASAIPTLLVSGEYDPITPPEYAEQAMKHLEKAKHFVLDGQGHFVSAAGCMPHLIEKFVSDSSAENLDASCLKRLSAAPLYLNFNGTAP